MKVPSKPFAVIFMTLLFFALLSVPQSASTGSVYRNPAKQPTPTTFNKPALVRRYQQTITATSLASRLYFLASDFFEGRETTTRGQKLAAEYLASQYRLMGLTPKGTTKAADPLSGAGYLQSFPVYKRLAKGARLDVVRNGANVASSIFSPETHDDRFYFLSGDVANARGGVVFAGYGIADDRLGYNDYAALAAKGISIAGKWVMILDDEPLSDASTSLLPTPDHKPSVWTTQSPHKRRAVWNAGNPAGVLIVKGLTPRMQGTFADATSMAARNAQQVGNLRLSRSSPFPPTYAISTELANQILSGSGRQIEDLRSEINQSLKPAVFNVDEVVVNTTVEEFKSLETENVLAFIEGSDLKDQVVIVSSHYDHLGTNGDLKGDQIYNGAADDGSGVVASLDLAQAFMRANRDGFGPRRSLLFVNFSGEEKGLLGSSHYALNAPVIPLEKTIADINLDGVGGIDPKHPSHSKNYIYIDASRDGSDELVEITERIKGITKSSVEVTAAPSGFNSDNKSFQVQLIPYIYYSTGFTEHYHQPSDEPNTIDYEHLAKVTQLIFATAWQIANQEKRLRNVNRNELTLLGYVCPPCPFECDRHVYNHLGECPICGMTLVPKYSTRS